MSLRFFAEKVILELNCNKITSLYLRTPILCLVQMMSLIAQNHFFIASKNTNSVFSANDEVARPRMLKNFSLSEKMLLNAILGVKAQKH